MKSAAPAGPYGAPGSGVAIGAGGGIVDADAAVPACSALLTSVPALAIGGAVIGATIGTAPGMFGTGIAYRTPGSGACPGTGGGVGSRGWLTGVAACIGVEIRPSSAGAGPGGGVGSRG